MYIYIYIYTLCSPAPASARARPNRGPARDQIARRGRAPVDCPKGKRSETAEGGMVRLENPHRAQISRFELFELVLLVKSDNRFPVEQFEAAVSQSTVPSPPPLKTWRWLLTGGQHRPRHGSVARLMQNILRLLPVSSN